MYVECFHHILFITNIHQSASLSS